MPRSMNAGMSTAVGAEAGSLVHFIELNTSDGPLYLTTAPGDVSWDSKTWQGVGGSLGFESVQEGPEAVSFATGLEVAGVDTAILDTLLTYHFRGRECVIHYGKVDLSAGTIVDAPLEIFRGFLHDDLKVREERGEGATGTVKITTRVSSRLAALNQAMPVRTNLHSHRDMLRRAGLTGADLLDDFFKFVPQLVNLEIYWNQEAVRFTQQGYRSGRRDPTGRSAKSR